MKKIFYLIIFSLLVACAEIKTDPSFIDQRAKNQIEEIEETLSDLNNKSAHLITPDLYEEAKEVVDTSQEKLKEGQRFNQFQENFSRFSMLKGKIKTKMDISRTHIEDVIKAREQAIYAGANKTEALAEADEAFRDLGDAIEDNDITEVLEEKYEVKRLYQLAEVDAIKNQKLSVTWLNYEKINGLEGDEYFPKLYKKLENAISKTESIINQNKDDTQKINNQIVIAEDMSKRLLALSQTVKWIETEKPSELAFRMEKDFNQFFQDLYSPYTASHQSAAENFKTLRKETNYVPSLRSEIVRLSKTNNILDKRVNEVLSRKKLLTAKIAESKEIRQRIKNFKREVGNENVDVLRKGEAILVRVKGMNFGFNKTRIPANAKPIMNEVVAFIDEFKEPSIVVEGHSDAIGNPNYNEKISKKRADKVLNFISEKSKTELASATTVGHGFNRPITDNRTASGRAMNRRIDILIYPRS